MVNLFVSSALSALAGLASRITLHILKEADGIKALFDEKIWFACSFCNFAKCLRLAEEQRCNFACTTKIPVRHLFQWNSNFAVR
jgi:hypothetical protein